MHFWGVVLQVETKTKGLLWSSLRRIFVCFCYFTMPGINFEFQGYGLKFIDVNLWILCSCESQWKQQDTPSQLQ